jgi:hypothetical protein
MGEWRVFLRRDSRPFLFRILEKKENKIKIWRRLVGVECVWLVLAAGWCSIVIISFPVCASAADDRMEAGQLVEKARMAFESMVGDPNL